MKFVRMAALAAALTLAFVGCSRENPTAPGAGGDFKAVTGLGDRVWLDTNENGIQEEGEPGVAGVVVSLQDCSGTEAAADTTDSEGYYLFADFDSGEYQVAFALPEGHRFTLQHAGTDTTLDSDVDPETGVTACLALADTVTELSVDAGLVELPQLGTLGDWVWHDENENGLQDAGEMGLAGVVVTLTDCSGAAVMADTTDMDGMYLFADIAAGDYMIHVMLPDSTWAFSPMHVDTNTAIDSDIDPATGATMCLTLAADEVNLDVDAGLYMPFMGDGCAHGKGYWKNHPMEMEPLLPITLGNEGGDKSQVVDSPETAVAVLQQHTWGHPSNGITKLYAQLLTAKLNIANGADGSRSEVEIGMADDFLADHDWTDWDSLDRAEKRAVQRMLGSFKVYSVGDNCRDDDHDDDGDCDDGDGHDDDDDDDDDGDDDDDDGGDDDDDHGHGGGNGHGGNS